ncbi:Acyl-CoA thioester hydrolase YciA [Buchnera aphidicola (Cinara kochiana kochiana)]|uniref:Acyl-CoA thioester hydrolase YciA n=1 Tax=Buchnera aphidicola (Cinara kochiana kochiana) TaxID=2518976 RepID=A0A451D5N0_9GAMM|nr:hotdog domain-containing protein [Buchnera aphidicola]VFP81093.1 Acyl-CoA thioester hydrolase YciA [Buchnera aphidicola (Cinara kochiana kochiana)]
MPNRKDSNVVCDKNLMLRTLAMPSHNNVNGNIFGGWIMSQMDLGGGILAKKISQGKISTSYIKDINFIKPIFAGDLVSCYANCVNIKNTAIKIYIEIWIKKITTHSYGLTYCTNTAFFTYVAIDDYGKPRVFSTI